MSYVCHNLIYLCAIFMQMLLTSSQKVGHDGNNLTCTEPEYCPSLRADECYYNSDQCCLRCMEFNTGDQDCTYGDRASICRESLCRHSVNKNVCCWTCRPEVDTSTHVTTRDLTFTTEDAGDVSIDPLDDVISTGNVVQCFCETIGLFCFVVLSIVFRVV